MSRPLLIECPRCRNAKGVAEKCTHCDRRGKIEVTECPMTYVGTAFWTMVELCRFAEKGTWPVGGGTLDQTANFLAFYSRWQNTLDRLKAEQHGEAGL